MLRKIILYFSNIANILLLLIIILLALGILIQYSAGSGNFKIYALPFSIKIILGFIALYIFANIDLKIIYLLTEVIFIASILLLILVEIIGETRLGAKRWLDLGIFSFQPSELVKITLILMLAKYFHSVDKIQSKKITTYPLPILISLIPFFLILIQPDLGTASILILISATIFFLSGFRLLYAGILVLIIIISLPITWTQLKNYQKQRIITFINPEKDPLGAGYHTIQSKIAIGSGGIFGKGLLSGTQSQLDFLPEKHTDFIFTLIAEEFGFIASTLLIILYMSIIIIITIIANSCSYSFGKYVVSGINTMLFIYIFINIAMVSGIFPIVGVPLPLISFGGTHLIALMISFGLIFNIHKNKNYI